MVSPKRAVFKTEIKTEYAKDDLNEFNKANIQQAFKDGDAEMGKTLEAEDLEFVQNGYTHKVEVFGFDGGGHTRCHFPIDIEYIGNIKDYLADRLVGHRYDPVAWKLFELKVM